MSKYYFDLDRVDWIKLTRSKETAHRWYDEVKPTYRYFLGFQTGVKSPGEMAGWSEYQNGWGRVSTQTLSEASRFQIDLERGRVILKAKVTVFSEYNGDSQARFSTYFDSDLAAQEYVDSLVKKSNRNFAVID
jgi:hypothetical protein